MMLHAQTELQTQTDERRWKRTCALGDVLEQQRVLGESLHLCRDDILQLKPPALRLALCFLEEINQVKDRK